MNGIFIKCHVHFQIVTVKCLVKNNSQSILNLMQNKSTWFNVKHNPLLVAIKSAPPWPLVFLLALFKQSDHILQITLSTTAFVLRYQHEWLHSPSCMYPTANMIMNDVASTQNGGRKCQGILSSAIFHDLSQHTSSGSIKVVFSVAGRNI